MVANHQGNRLQNKNLILEITQQTHFVCRYFQNSDCIAVYWAITGYGKRGGFAVYQLPFGKGRKLLDRSGKLLDAVRQLNADDHRALVDESLTELRGAVDSRRSMTGAKV